MVGLRKKLYNFPKSKAAHEKFKIEIKAKPVSTKFKENEENLRRRMQWAAAISQAKSDDPEVTKILDELIGYLSPAVNRVSVKGYLCLIALGADLMIFQSGIQSSSTTCALASKWSIRLWLRRSGRSSPLSEGSKAKRLSQPSAASRVLIICGVAGSGRRGC